MSNKSRLEGNMAPLVKPDEGQFGVSFGTDSTLPFATPYQPVNTEQSARRDPSQKYEIGSYTGEDEPSLAELALMRRKDGQAQALHRLLTLPIRASLKKAKVVAVEGGETEAQFVSDVLFTPPGHGGMTVPFNRVMAQILESLFTGFSAFEKVYWKPSHGPLKGKVTLKKLGYRPPLTVSFITDTNGGFEGIRQRIWNGPEYRDVYIDPQYCFYFAAQEELRKFYGVSFFQAAYYHWDKKTKLEYVAHLAGQRSAVGTRVGTVPGNASNTQKREFSRALSNMALSQYLAIPEGFEIDVLKEGGNFDFQKLIDYHNSQMSKSVLANFFDQDQSAGGSSSLISFGEPGNEMFILMLRAIMDDIAAAINTYIIPPLIDYNWPKSRKYPQFVWGDLTDSQQKAVAELFKKLASAGQSLTITPEYMRALEENMAEELGLDIDYDAVDAREAEEQALAEAEFAAQQGQEGLTGPEGESLPMAEEITPEEAETSLAELEASLLKGETPPDEEEEPAPEGVESTVGA